MINFALGKVIEIFLIVHYMMMISLNYCLSIFESMGMALARPHSCFYNELWTPLPLVEPLEITTAPHCLKFQV